MPCRNGQQGMDPGLQPINIKLYISLHPDTKPTDPPQSGPVTHSCQLVNQQNSLGWGGCDNLTTNWPYQGHKIPYLVPRTINCLPALWPDSDNWAHTPGMYSVATKSWWVLYSWLIEDPLWDDPGGIHNRISERRWILLSDMNGQISNTTLYQISHQLTTFSIWINPHYWTPPLEFVYSAWVAMGDPTCEGRLICPEGRVSLLNKCNPIQILECWPLGAFFWPLLSDPRGPLELDIGPHRWTLILMKAQPTSGYRKFTYTYLLHSGSSTAMTRQQHLLIFPLHLIHHRPQMEHYIQQAF